MGSALQKEISSVEIEYPTVQELQNHIKKLKTTKAPGLDGLHNSLIKQLPMRALIFLNFIFMACLRLSYFPGSWKLAKVIAVPKPGKNPSDPTSYRPISLLSSLSKLYERVLLKRINLHAHVSKIFPPEQFGFRSKHSTTQQLLRIKGEIERKYSRCKTSTGMILIDVEKAFDRVWHAGLIYKMIKFKFPLYIIKVINSFLKNRRYFVEIQKQKSNVKSMRFGVPQGAVL